MNPAFSMALSRRGIVVLLAFLAAGVSVRLRLWPLYREWISQADSSILLKELQLDSTRLLLARTRHFNDSMPVWRRRLQSLRDSRMASLDALQRSGIRGLTSLADSAGVLTESIVAEAYTARSLETCRFEPCVRVVTLRGTFVGDTESSLELISLLDSGSSGLILRDVSLQPQSGAGTSLSPSQLRIEARIGVAGMLSAIGPP
jgi:hypothetical protein